MWPSSQCPSISVKETDVIFGLTGGAYSFFSSFSSLKTSNRKFLREMRNLLEDI